MCFLFGLNTFGSAILFSVVGSIFDLLSTTVRLKSSWPKFSVPLTYRLVPCTFGSSTVTVGSAGGFFDGTAVAFLDFMKDTKLFSCSGKVKRTLRDVLFDDSMSLQRIEITKIFIFNWKNEIQTFELILFLSIHSQFTGHVLSTTPVALTYISIMQSAVLNEIKNKIVKFLLSLIIWNEMEWREIVSVFAHAMQHTRILSVCIRVERSKFCIFNR